MTKLPQQLAGFEIVRRLGTGGMAEVFLAKKRGAEGTYKLLVLKRILPAHASSRRFRTMFVEEALLATRLNHPNIVQVYEFSDHGDEGLLLSMEHVDGHDLGRVMSAAKQQGHAHPALRGRLHRRRGRQGPALRARAQATRAACRSPSCTATCRRRTSSCRTTGT
jgi:serine/threonine protein kinase